MCASHLFAGISASCDDGHAANFEDCAVISEASLCNGDTVVLHFMVVCRVELTSCWCFKSSTLLEVECGLDLV